MFIIIHPDRLHGIRKAPWVTGQATL